MDIKKLTHIIETLQCWKTAFMNTDFSFERSLGMCEIRDELSGISVGTSNNYAKELFDGLTEEEKSYIQSKLDFDVNFEKLYATYDLEEAS